MQENFLLGQVLTQKVMNNLHPHTFLTPQARPHWIQLSNLGVNNPNQIDKLQVFYGIAQKVIIPI